MDSLPAFSTDLLAALLSVDGSAGPLGQGVSQRGPPGESTGDPVALHPGALPFADLLSGLVLPAGGGPPLPMGGNALPDATAAALQLPVLLKPGSAVPVPPAAPLSTSIGPSSGAEIISLTSAPEPGTTAFPAAEPYPRTPVTLTSPESSAPAQRLEPPQEPIPVRVDATAQLPAQPPQLRRAGPLPGSHQGRGTDGPGPVSTSLPSAPAVEWSLTERPIKLEPQQQPVAEMTPRELPREPTGPARHIFTSAAPHEPGSAVAGGVTTTASASPGLQVAEPLSPGATTSFTSTPPSTVDAASLAGRVHWMIDNAVGEARLKLNPPELGALDIRISLVDDKAYVQLAATQPGATELLEGALPRLRELLNVGGLELAGATVSHEGAERGAPRHPTGEFQWKSLDGEPEEGALEGRPRPVLGQIDLYA